MNGSHSVVDGVNEVVARIPSRLPQSHRYVIALAGPPAAGKSTLAEALVDKLDGRAALVGMDAFHLDDSILEARGHRTRKGAPHTFDAMAYGNTIRFLRDNPNVETTAPVFDRTSELSRNCATVITEQHEIIVTEGNYLLLNAEPWQSLRPLFDLTVWVDTPLSVLSERLDDRWRSLGLLDHEVRAKAEYNDLPNARLVQEHSSPGMVLIRSG